MAAAPYIASAAGAIIGGAMNRDSLEDQAYQNTQLQREFAQKGIQWKTADAKKAGLHPLYAMGASTIPYQSQPLQNDGIGDAVAQLGQQAGRGLSAYNEKKANAPQVKIAAAAAAQAQTAQLQLSEEQRMHVRAQTMNLMQIMRYRNKDWTAEHGGADGMSADITQEEDGVMPGQIQGVPSQQESASKTNPDVVAGTHTFFKRYSVNGTPVFLPNSSDAGESLENITWYMWPTIIKYNKDHLRPADFENMLKLIPGAESVVNRYNKLFPEDQLGYAFGGPELSGTRTNRRSHSGRITTKEIK